jgi:hypothetical protein
MAKPTPAQYRIMQAIVRDGGLLSVSGTTRSAMQRRGWLAYDGTRWYLTASGQRVFDRYQREVNNV